MLCLIDSIRHDDPAVQRLCSAVAAAHTLTELLRAAWPLARILVMQVVESGLAERARRPPSWPSCPACGALLQSQGFAKRQVTSLCGPIRWQRRGGRCPQRCDTPQVVPLEAELGVPPHQRSSEEFPHVDCALAVCVPFATAATRLGGSSGDPVSPRAVGGWVQAAGGRAMEKLQEQWQAVANGDLPPEEPLAAELKAATLLMGADGGMVPCRPEGGQPTGQTRWREIKGGVLARLGSHGTRTGKVVARPALRLWSHLSSAGIMGHRTVA